MTQENYLKAKAYLKKNKISYYADYTNFDKNHISIKPIPLFINITNRAYDIHRQYLESLCDKTRKFRGVAYRFIFFDAKKATRKTSMKRLFNRGENI